MKKQYTTPELQRFGTLSELSAGGAGSVVEADGQSMDPARRA